MFETMTLPISDIICLCQKPISLLRYDHSTQAVLRVDEEVRRRVMRVRQNLCDAGILGIFRTPSA